MSEGADSRTIALLAGGILVVCLIQLVLWATRFRKVPPNAALIVTGRKRTARGPDGALRSVGYRIVKGGATFVWPVFEEARVLSLEAFGARVAFEGFEASAHVRIRGDDASIAAAAERFLSKKPEEIATIAGDFLARHARAALAEGLGREALEARVTERAAGELHPMGLELVSFTVKEMRGKA